MNENAFKLFLILHIMGGSVGLIAGTINMIRKKGDKKHKIIGKFFLHGMLTAGIAALILSVLHPNYFLFIVGVFTIYMVATGQRYLFHRGVLVNQKQIGLDWLLTILMLLFVI